MNQFQTKILFIQKPYFQEIRDSIRFKLINPKLMEDLDYYAKGYFKDIRKHQAVNILQAYQYLNSIRGLLPPDCSHQWLHDYLISLTKQGSVKKEISCFSILTEKDLISALNWPGVETNMFTKVGSTVWIPKFYGIDISIDSNGKYFDENLMVFATAVP